MGMFSCFPRSLVPRWSRRRRRAFTLIELLVVLCVIVVLIVLLFPATRGRAGDSARRVQCKNNLKQIGLALHNYHDTYGSFPPAYTVDAEGNRLHSWRTLILPYIDQAPLYKTIDLSKPWDDPVNAKARETRVYGYACPSANGKPSQTNYLAVSTSQSVFPGAEAIKIIDIKDGTSNTMMIIEVPADQAVEWMSPYDADEALLAKFTAESKESHTGGRQVLLVDGSVHFLDQKKHSGDIIHKLTTISGGDSGICDEF